MPLPPTLTLAKATIAPLVDRIRAVVLWHSPNLEIAFWNDMNRSELSTELVELAIRYHTTSTACLNLRQQANAEEARQTLPPIPFYPFENIRTIQVAQVCECLGWGWEERFMDVDETREQATTILEARLAHLTVEGVLTELRLVGALVLLTSAVYGLESERAALNGRFFLPNGTWDRDRTEIKNVLRQLAEAE